jgi:hypothetical protein
MNSANLERNEIVEIGNNFLKAYYGFEGINGVDDK